MGYEDGVFATFKDQPVYNKRESKEKGYPVYDNVTFLEVIVPNSVDSVPRPATDADKQRFPKAWQAYCTGKEEVDDGFPLQEWVGITAGEMAMCHANQIKTVEQLADVADVNIHRLGAGGMTLKVRAQKFLAERETSSNDKERIKALEAKIEKLENQLAAAKPKRKRVKVTG